MHHINEYMSDVGCSDITVLREDILASKSSGCLVCSAEEKFSVAKNVSDKHSCCKSSDNPMRYLEIPAS